VYQRTIAVIIVILMVLGGGFYVYKQLLEPMQVEAQGPVYATSAVTRGDISVGVNTSGRLDPSSGGGIRVSDVFRNTKISELVIEEILVKEGDTVSRQQTVVRLSAPSLDNDLAELRDQIKREKEYLSNITGVPLEQVMNIDPSRGVTISAPIKGRVQEMSLEEGDEVAQGQTIARVVDVSTYNITLDLAMPEYSMVKKGQAVKLRFPYFEGLQNGVIKHINSNPVPFKEKEEDFASSFVYKASIEGDNQGLVQKAMEVEVGIERTPGQVYFFRNKSHVDGFVKEERVFSNTEGIVAEVHAEEMAEVEKGDPIITLAGSEVEDTIRERLDKIRELESDLRQLISAIEMLNVKSPMDGIVAGIYSQEGNTVSPGEWIGNIYQTSQMAMMSTVDDIDIIHVTQGAPVKVTVDALPEEVFEGEVRDIHTNWSSDGKATQFMVYIEIKGGELLRPGMQARAHIDAGSAEDVLLVPIEAVFQEDNTYKVEVLGENGVPSVVAVEIGLMNDRLAEIKSGLKEGDLVVTGSSSDLLPTQNVEQNNNLIPKKADEGGEE
jgi:HlyD family secretion protein